jgi:NTP pyrophosphatase (non-canonical NTP hydrolase)
MHIGWFIKIKNMTKKLEKGSISNLQKYIEKKVKQRGFEDETVQERLLLLCEEVGELINAARKITGMNTDKDREIKKEVGEEIADVINMIFAVGIKMKIDVEKEFILKEKIIDKRIYKRTHKKF